MPLPILRRNASPVSGRGHATPLETRVDPWNDFSLMDRLFDRFMNTPLSLFGSELGRMPAHVEPTLELYETKDDLLAFVALPGVTSDSFDVDASPDTITVKADRKPLLEAGEDLISHTTWVNHAISAHTFSTTYNLPVEIDPSRVTASYKDGVLKVTMPKSEAAKPKSVKVSVNS